MSYLVLARKYRPKTFAEVVGQEHITQLLKKSIESNRIAHAFLFCGPRGIGKTSCARILAKSLNCQEGPTLTPCGKCFPCQEIASSNSFDVIEIDGASNRGIDEIRTLRENVKFAPAYGRYKIYIVDEVHMLTLEAFNALLKTLEEPPEHVKFIFATTESNKVPATILSRCQRFDFKRIGVDTIEKALKDICVKEKLKIDDPALFAIAKAAQGSMRDALSILDQLSALGSEGIDAKDVFSMLGMVEIELLFQLTDALVDKNCVAALKVFNEIIERGKDIKQLGKDLTEHFRHMMIIKIGGQELSALVDYPAAVKQRLSVQAQRISIVGILKVIELFIEAQETARVMETLRMPLELAFAKMAYSGQAQAQADLAQPVPATAKPSVPSVDASLQDIQAKWNSMTHEVSRRKMSVATYLQDGLPYAFKDGQLIIAFNKDHVFQKESLESKENLTLLEKVFGEKLGVPVRVALQIRDVTAPPKKDEAAVKAALEMFGGEVIKEWHNN